MRRFGTLLLHVSRSTGSFAFQNPKEIAMPGKNLPSLRQAVVLAGLLLSCCLFGFAQSRMTVRREVHRDISPPLREMIKLMPPPSLARHEAEPVRRIPLPPCLDAQGEVEDSVRQQT